MFLAMNRIYCILLSSITLVYDFFLNQVKVLWISYDFYRNQLDIGYQNQVGVSFYDIVMMFQRFRDNRNQFGSVRKNYDSREETNKGRRTKYCCDWTRDVLLGAKGGYSPGCRKSFLMTFFVFIFDLLKF